MLNLLLKLIMVKYKEERNRILFLQKIIASLIAAARYCLILKSRFDFIKKLEETLTSSWSKFLQFYKKLWKLNVFVAVA